MNSKELNKYMEDNNLNFIYKNTDELKKMLQADVYDDAMRFDSKYFNIQTEVDDRLIKA